MRDQEGNHQKSPGRVSGSDHPEFQTVDAECRPEIVGDVEQPAQPEQRADITCTDR